MFHVKHTINYNEEDRTVGQYDQAHDSAAFVSVEALYLFVIIGSFRMDIHVCAHSEAHPCASAPYITAISGSNVSELASSKCRLIDSRTVLSSDF